MENRLCWRRWGVLWLLLLLTVPAAAISFGRSPPAPGLPEQVCRAELIVVGKLQPWEKRTIIPPRPGEKGPNAFRYAWVPIDVREVLKGKADLKTVPLRLNIGFVDNPLDESEPGIYRSTHDGVWILTGEAGQYVGPCLPIEKQDEILALLPGVKRPAATRPAPATQPLDARAAADLIRQLGADDFATREAAMKKLIEAGDVVRPLVEEQLKSADPEVAQRAALILARLSVGLGSKPVEKDGLSVSILPRKRAFGRGEMPSFLVVFKNVSDRPFRLHEDRYLVNWKFAAGPNAHIVFCEYQQALRGATAGKQDQQLLRHLPPGQSQYVALTAEQFYITQPLGAAKPGGRDEQPPPARILPPTEGVYELSVYIWLGRDDPDSWRGELTTNPASFAVAFDALGGALLPVPETPAPPKAGPLTITGHFRHAGKPGLVRGKPVMPAGELWGDDGYTYTVWSEAQVDVGLDRKPVRVEGKCWGPMMHEGKLMREKLTIEGAKVTPVSEK